MTRGWAKKARADSSRQRRVLHKGREDRSRDAASGRIGERRRPLLRRHMSRQTRQSESRARASSASSSRMSDLEVVGPMTEEARRLKQEVAKIVRDHQERQERRKADTLKKNENKSRITTDDQDIPSSECPRLALRHGASSLSFSTSTLAGGETPVARIVAADEMRWSIGENFQSCDESASMPGTRSMIQQSKLSHEHHPGGLPRRCGHTESSTISPDPPRRRRTQVHHRPYEGQV